MANLSIKNLQTLSPTAIERFVTSLDKLDDKQLLQAMREARDDSLKYGSLAMTRMVQLGLGLEAAYERYGRSGGYQQYLDALGISQPKAHRVRTIADGFRRGLLPDRNPADRDGEGEWDQSSALKYIDDHKHADVSPVASPAEVQAAVARVRDRRQAAARGGHDELMRKASRLVGEIEKVSYEGSAIEVAGVVGYLLQQMRRLNRDCAEAVDAEVEQEEQDNAQ